MPISTGTALLGGSALQGIGSLFGGGKAASAATDAAQIQANASLQAAQLQHQQFEQTTQNLAPFVQGGGAAFQGLINNLPSLEAPVSTWGMQQFTPTMDSLAATPGYQFTLQQGLQATNAAYAPSGLAGSVTGGRASPSGPLAAAQTSFATGAASTTFNQQYQNWLAGQSLGLSQKAQQFGFQAGPANLGESAAAGQGSIGAQTAGAIGQTILAGAAAQGAGVVGSANALNAGLAGAGSAASNAGLLYALNNAGMFGGGGGGALTPAEINAPAQGFGGGSDF